jgi:GxxExxY protein
MGGAQKKVDIIHPKLSYKLMGVFFDVFKELGPGHKERYYEEAIAKALTSNKIKYQRQIQLPLEYKGEKVGKYIVDFLVEDKVVVELKQGDYFRHTNIQQVVQYLKMLDKKLGILVHFSSKGVKYKRVLNIYDR